MDIDPKEYLAPGHRACAGCGATIAVRLALKALGENTVAVSATGCLEVVTTPYPETAWEIPWIHVAFENASAVASGVEEALKSQGKEDTNIVVFGG
ncbi:MAG: 2-ketoisovalerate ferredoxin oxidoreductase, partial [Methanosphaera sp. rholeuAM74]